MLNPVDMLIGPALRYPQGPHAGQVPGSHKAYSPAVGAFGAVAGVLAIGWGIWKVTHRAAK